MLESASPRNPKDRMLVRSSTFSILLVAWRRKAVRTWSAGIPAPSSVTRIIAMPPSLISTVVAVAPASMAFSVSSLTMLLGLSTTSPAAILSIVACSSRWITAMTPSLRPDFCLTPNHLDSHLLCSQVIRPSVHPDIIRIFFCKTSTLSRVLLGNALMSGSRTGMLMPSACCRKTLFQAPFQRFFILFWSA